MALLEAWEIWTPRLLIRPMQPEDCDVWHHCRALMPFDPYTDTPAQSREALMRMQRRPHLMAPGWQQFAVLGRSGAPGGGRADEGPFLGDFGVGFEDPSPGQAMLGFAMMPEARGLGLAQEAGQALLERLFAQGLRRVAAVTDIRNLPAQRLLGRLGFAQEARYRQSWWDGNGWQDELGFARLVAD